MQAEIWSTQVNCQELLSMLSHLAMTQPCAPSTDKLLILSRGASASESVYSISKCSTLTSLSSLFDRPLGLAVVEADKEVNSQGRQMWTCILSCGGRVKTILCLDGLTDDQQH